MSKGAKVGEKRSLPGKKSAELLSVRNEYVPKAVYNLTPIFVDHAKGALVEDVDGNEYIDFTGGIAVLNVGHRNDRVVLAIKEQLDKHLHTCFHALMYESYVKLAKKLAEITPGNFPKQVVLINSGAEAVENAVKVARRYTGRYGVIAFENAFHGRTTLCMGLTSQVRYFKYGFGPFDPGIQRFPYAYSYRAPFATTDADYGEYCVKRIEDSFKTYTPSEEIAAILVEPFLGEGGYVVPPVEFLRGLRRICDDYGILLIADEIQSGMGRTGKMWAVEHFEVVPDILVAAKSLGGGMVLSAVIGRKDILDSVDIGGLGSTFGGNPVSCVAALQTIEVIEQDKLLHKATKLGKIAKGRLEGMREKYGVIGDVRGLGSLIGVEFVADRKTKDPASKEVGEIRQKCLEGGLITMPCGVMHNVFRLMFPLVIKEDELEKGLDILEEAIREVDQAMS
jgi:4-aminobutyrate aminotransferase/(S)-3-amino-2-methylpropionate transaminase